MYFVTSEENIVRFNTEERAIKYVEKDSTKFELKLELVYDHKENNIRIMVYKFKEHFLKAYIIQEIK